jgi:hypothetical protein
MLSHGRSRYNIGTEPFGSQSADDLWTQYCVAVLNCRVNWRRLSNAELSQSRSVLSGASVQPVGFRLKSYRSHVNPLDTLPSAGQAAKVNRSWDVSGPRRPLLQVQLVHYPVWAVTIATRCRPDSEHARPPAVAGSRNTMQKFGGVA